MKRNCIRDIMSVDPNYLNEKSNVTEVLQLINTEGYSHIPIVEAGKVQGVVSKSDLIKHLARFLMETSGKVYSQFLLEHFPVSTLMTKDPICVRETDDVDYAAELLLQGEFHGLFVLNESERLVGVVTSYDLLSALYSDSIGEITELSAREE